MYVRMQIFLSVGGLGFYFELRVIFKRFLEILFVKNISMRKLE
jgi:hypothetical protein